MRIAMVAPLEIRVPPVAYGGIELVVSLLTEGLVRRGHEVTLFSSGDSVTSARLEAGCPHFLRGSGSDKGILNMLSVVSCLEQAERFDIIHNHTCFEGLATAGLVKTPVLTTLHGGLSADWLLLFQHYKGWYNTISQSARSLLPPKERFAGVIYNAIDCASYPFNGGKGNDYLLFLSRLSPEKGPHLAIEVARKSGARLIMAGNVDSTDREYFRHEVLPHVDGDQVRYVGEADYFRKRELLSGARCLLAPITWSEPFGLFMVEAMVCGTPVVAFNRGSAPEVVKHGETGFVVDTLAEMVEAVHRVDQIARQRCREHVEQNFDVPRMVEGYLRAYRQVLETESEKVGVPTPFPLEGTAPYAAPDTRHAKGGTFSLPSPGEIKLQRPLVSGDGTPSSIVPN